MMQAAGTTTDFHCCASHSTGKERDSESGLDNFGARYNSSTLGRFMSPDQGRFSWADPQSLNRYTYTRNNPLRYVDPTGRYFVVSSDAQAQIKQYISTLLRTDSGRKLVIGIGLSPRANSFAFGQLPRTKIPNGYNVVTGISKPVLGNSPGAVAGTTTTLDPSNISFVASLKGTSDFLAGLDTFAHEGFHVSDMNSAGTLAAAAAAGVAGDASHPGTSDTMAGTAEARAQGALSDLGPSANTYTPDPATDLEANQLIAYGQLQAQLASAKNIIQTEEVPPPTTLILRTTDDSP